MYMYINVYIQHGEYIMTFTCLCTVSKEQWDHKIHNKMYVQLCRYAFTVFTETSYTPLLMWTNRDNMQFWTKLQFCISYPAHSHVFNSTYSTTGTPKCSIAHMDMYNIHVHCIMYAKSKVLHRARGYLCMVEYSSWSLMSWYSIMVTLHIYSWWFVYAGY